MANPGRPARAALILVLTIVLGLGLAAYFVNVPLPWIALAELVALLAIGAWLTRARRTEPVTSGASGGTSKADSK